MKQNKFLQSVLSNWPVKIISVMLAIALYLIVQYSTVDHREVAIPLHVSLPSGYVAKSTIPNSVKLVISGDEAVIYLIDPSSITASADFSSVQDEGVTSVPVFLSYREYPLHGDIMIAADPEFLKVFFVVASEADASLEPAEDVGGIVL